MHLSTLTPSLLLLARLASAYIPADVPSEFHYDSLAAAYDDDQLQALVDLPAFEDIADDELELDTSPPPSIDDDDYLEDLVPLDELLRPVNDGREGELGEIVDDDDDEELPVIDDDDDDELPIDDGEEEADLPEEDDTDNDEELELDDPVPLLPIDDDALVDDNGNVLPTAIPAPSFSLTESALSSTSSAPAAGNWTGGWNTTVTTTFATRTRSAEQGLVTQDVLLNVTRTVVQPDGGSVPTGGLTGNGE